MALLLRNAQVWDGDAGDLVESDVRCAYGYVTGLLPPGSDRPASDDEVVEMDGAALLPGLIDGHVHLVWDSSADPAAATAAAGEQRTVLRAAEFAWRHLISGVTTVVDLGSNWDAAITVAEAVRDGDIVGPHVVAAGRTVAMTGGHDPFWVNPCDGVDAIIRGVREQVFLGARIIKTAATGGVYGQRHGEEVGASELTFDELAALACEARRRGVPTAAHALGTEGISNAVQAGINVIEHGVFLTEEIVANMVERGTALCPTLAVYQTIAAGSAPGYAVEKAKDVVKAHQQSVELAIAAGVPIIAGTDAGSPGMPHPILEQELGALLDAGMAPVDVLKAATSRAADALGLNAGRIAEGLPADFVCVDGDPLTDPTLATEAWGVVRAGNLLRDDR